MSILNEIAGISLTAKQMKEIKGGLSQGGSASGVARKKCNDVSCPADTVGSKTCSSYYFDPIAQKYDCRCGDPHHYKDCT